MEKDMSFKDIYESILNDKKNYNNFDEIVKEMNNEFKYEIESDRLIVENIENISINKEKKLLKLDEKFLKSLGKYSNLKKDNDKVIIEFDNFTVEYFLKPISKLVIKEKNEV